MILFYFDLETNTNCTCDFDMCIICDEINSAIHPISISFAVSLPSTDAFPQEETYPTTLDESTLDALHIAEVSLNTRASSSTVQPTSLDIKSLPSQLL